MGIRCWFNPCKWLHIEGHLYQCVYCKTVSVGVFRPRAGFGRNVDDAVEVNKPKPAPQNTPIRWENGVGV